MLAQLRPAQARTERLQRIAPALRRWRWRAPSWIDATVAAGSLYNRRESKIATHLGYAAAPIAETPEAPLAVDLGACHPRLHPPPGKLPRPSSPGPPSSYHIRLVAATEGWVAAPPGHPPIHLRQSRLQYRRAIADFVLDRLASADPRAPTAKPVPYTGIEALSIPEFPAIGNQVGQEIALALKGGQSAARPCAGPSRRPTNRCAIPATTPKPLAALRMPAAAAPAAESSR